MRFSIPMPAIASTPRDEQAHHRQPEQRVERDQPDEERNGPAGKERLLISFHPLIRRGSTHAAL
jgi:hypothetical protein